VRTRTSDDPAVPGWALRAVIVGAVLVLVGAATPQGGAVAGDLQRFLSYYAGVFTLLALTIAVVSGLLATERLILKIRHRVLAQAVHRAATVLAVTFVVAHILVKVLGGLAFPAQIIVPGTGPIGYGALAFDLLLVVMASGLLRARFARATRPWVWRTVHALAYVSWPLAIVHGLTAGRSSPAWATLSYVLSVGVVALAVLTRMIVVVKPREVRHTGDLISEPAPAREAAGREAGREVPGREAAGRRGPVRGAARAPDPRAAGLLGDGDPRSSEVMR
jgi:DMSO/TMAO reductase YedYZ heme-binding membrane subunit